MNEDGIRGILFGTICFIVKRIKTIITEIKIINVKDIQYIINNLMEKE